jgi:hypothetical protein
LIAALARLPPHLLYPRISNPEEPIVDDPTDFQVKFRLRMIERMALRAMIISAAHGRPLAEARSDSIAWLDSSISLSDEIAGGTRDRPAVAELYATEAREVIDDLIAQTNALVGELEAGRKGK